MLRWVGRRADGAEGDRVARVDAIAARAALLREAERSENGAPERRQACDVRVDVCHMRQRRQRLCHQMRLHLHTVFNEMLRIIGVDKYEFTCCLQVMKKIKLMTETRNALNGTVCLIRCK